MELLDVLDESYTFILWNSEKFNIVINELKERREKLCVKK